jgi:hypothetical protein
MTDVITAISTNLIPIIIGMVSAALMSAGFWFANKYQANVQVDWKMVASYVVVGAALGAFETYLGITVTFESIGGLLVANIGIITAVDVLLSGIFKSPTATYVMKYTGHTFYPIFTVVQNDGTITKYNEHDRCCSITVYRATNAVQQISKAISQVVASWSTGFTVTPAFTEGYSPVSVVFKVKVGRNSDTSEIKSCDVDFADGTSGTIPLSLNADKTSEGTIPHVYIFN